LDPTWFKTVPKTPQHATPTTPKKQKTYKNQRFLIICIMTPMCQNAPNIDPDIEPNPPKSRQVEHQVAILAPTWSNLAALAPT
jgi:hypothetical protein